MLLQSAIAFLFKSFVCSAVMLVYYWLFLRNRKMHGYNRAYLLVTVVLSLVIPLLHFEWSIKSQQVPAAFKLLQVLPGNGVEEKIYGHSSWLMYKDLIAFGMYGFVGLCILILLISKIVWIYRLKNKSEITTMQGFDFVHTQNNRAPFSFLNNIFWRDDIDMQSHSGKLILQHEITHVRQRHTLDKLFLQLVVVVCWLNPCYWIIQKELSLIHEFMADENAIPDNDTEAFAHMLLQMHYGNQFPDIVHPFFNSSTKRRLFMLNQFKRKGFSSWRKLMILPLIAAVIMLFSFNVNNAGVVRAKKTIVLALDAGHGGEDNGSSGPNGVKEKDLTLKITKRLAQMAEAYNVKVVATRPDDESVALDDRVMMVNNQSADVMISIHINEQAACDKLPSVGFDIMLGKGNGKYAASRVLGSAIAAQLQTIHVNSRLLDKSLHVLRNVNIPAVLIECGYVDNAADVARINNDAQLDKLCNTILTGVVAYQNNATK